MATCRGCGAQRARAVEHCLFCGHDSSFERLQSTERTIGYFWRVVLALAVGAAFLIALSIYSAARHPL